MPAVASSTRLCARRLHRCRRHAERAAGRQGQDAAPEEDLPKRCLSSGQSLLHGGVQGDEYTQAARTKRLVPAPAIAACMSSVDTRPRVSDTVGYASVCKHRHDAVSCGLLMQGPWQRRWPRVSGTARAPPAAAARGRGRRTAAIGARPGGPAGATRRPAARRRHWRATAKVPVFLSGFGGILVGYVSENIKIGVSSYFWAARETSSPESDYNSYGPARRWGLKLKWRRRHSFRTVRLWASMHGLSCCEGPWRSNCCTYFG